MSRAGADALAVTLARDLGAEAVSETAELPGVPAGLPLAAPADEEGVCELLARAGRDRLCVLPIGFGTKLGARPPLAAPDLVLTTRRLAGVVAYEPGDGTLTARAGSTLAQLARAVREGGHHLTPSVSSPVTASLGGVLAAAQSGIDRTRFGPVAHHVLGARAALADGTRSRSGGRLVKNVTGFDLHRLWCGSHGTLCVLLEATLRLAPLPRATLALRARTKDLGDALARAERVLTPARPDDLVRPWALVVERSAAGDVELACVLGGSEAHVAWEAERVRAALGDVDVATGPAARGRLDVLVDLEREAGRWPAVTLETRRSRLAELAAALAPHAGRMRVHPAFARVEAWPRDASPQAAEALAAAAMPWRTRADEATQRTVRALVGRLRDQLDPGRVLVPRAGIGTEGDGSQVPPWTPRS